MYIMEMEQEGGRPRRRAPFIARMWLVLLAVAVWSSTLPKAAGVPVHPSELPILRSLQQAWDRSFAGWDGVGDCNTTAHGLMCNSEGRVVYLWLESNQLTGSIPTSIGALTNLKILWLENNQLNGSIPTSIGALKNLKILSLSYNLLTRSIPTSIGALTNLQELWLGSNELTGSIPTSIGALIKLQWLSLGSNNLTGSIPDSIGALTNLQELSVWDNALTGSIPSSIGALTNLQTLSLGSNNLTGSIPDSVGALTNLQELRLGSNQLTGSIPTSIGALTNLQELDINDNQLTGILPTTLMALTALNIFNYDSQPFFCPAIGGYCPLKKAGYGGLMFCGSCSEFCSTCVAGEPVSPTIQTTPPPSSNITSDGYSGGSSAMSTGALVGIVCGAVGAIALVSFLVLCIWKQRNHRINYGKDKEDVAGGAVLHREDSCGSMEAGKPRDWVAQLFRPMTLAELRKATNNFSEKRLLGRGGFGAVYLGHGPGGQKWAVKRSIKTGSRVDDAFKQEVLKLSRLTNPHLVSLLGFCIEKKEQIVVYEFVENGSLRTAVHESNRPLSFEQRLTIACGVAGGLHFLHDQKPSIVHRDIKPDNILLDAQWRAKVADFGLLRTLDGQQSTYTQGAGTIGYMDPEYWTSLRLTTASDVYSFGMVLLEMFTGRNLLVDSQQDLQHAGELQLMHNPMPVPIPLGVESNTLSSSRNSSTGQNPLSSTNPESTSITSSSGASLPLGKQNPLDAERQQERIPLRAWVVSVQEKYHGEGTIWLSVVLDPSLQPDYLPVNVVEKVLQIGIECSARESSSRPDIRTVKEGLLKLAAQLEFRGM